MEPPIALRRLASSYDLPLECSDRKFYRRYSIKIESHIRANHVTDHIGPVESLRKLARSNKDYLRRERWTVNYYTNNIDTAKDVIDLVKSVIHTESSWNHKAVSTSGAIGLMQVKPSTAMSEFKTPEQDLYDPYVNVTVGIMYLSELYHNSGDDWHYALTSYSHGPTATRKYSPSYVYNNFYIDKVSRHFDLNKEGDS